MSDAPATPAAPPSATPSATPAASPAASATPQHPVASPAPSSPPPPAPSAEPPRERWEDILRNTREKTRREVDAEYRQRYGRYDAFETDPWGAVQEWLSQASRHSLYGDKVKQWAQQYQQPAAEAIEPQPDVPIADAQGQITGYTYSAQRLKEWHKWSQTQQQQSMQERFDKLEERTARQDQFVNQAQSAAWANQTLGEFRKLPYFSEHEADIRDALAEHEDWGDNLHAAYNHVLVTKILPTLSQAEQAKALADLNHKASGATVNPGQAPPARPQFKTFKAAAEYYAAHPDEAAAAAQRS